MAYSVFIFDLDGTLINTSPGILECVRLTQEHFGFEQLEMETLKKFIGPPILESFIKYYNVSEEKGTEMLEYFRSVYWTNGMCQGYVYPGCAELLQKLRKKGCKLGVATMKVENFAFKTLKLFNIFDSFDFIAGYNDADKPTKAMLIDKCLSEFGVKDKASVLMIGDSIFDGEGAFNAGVDYAAMVDGLGYLTKEDLYKFPSVLHAKDYAELDSFIEGSQK